MKGSEFLLSPSHHCAQCWTRAIDTYFVACLSVCVCVLLTTVNPAKPGEPIEMQFDVWTQVSQKNHIILQGGPDPPLEGAILEE